MESGERICKRLHIGFRSAARESLLYENSIWVRYLSLFVVVQVNSEFIRMKEWFAIETSLFKGPK